MTPTMKDVAHEAGVSVKSVSRVVNDHPNISHDVRRRVLQAIETLEWRPNPYARSLRTGRTGLIAVSIQDLRTPTAARMVQELVAEAERQDLNVSIEPSHGSPAKVRQTLDARGRTFDAVVHVGPVSEPGLFESQDGGLPIVAISSGLDPEVPLGADRVDPDSHASAQILLRHLQSVGHHRAIILAGSPDRPDAFVTQLQDTLPDATTLRCEGTVDRSAGRCLAREVLTASPDVDAVVCASDELAIGALTYFVEHGVDVPGRIAVTGHGNAEDGEFTTPSLTTIDLRIPQLARLALDRIRIRLAGKAEEPQRTVVPVTVIRRESTLGSTAGIYHASERWSDRWHE